MLGLDVTLGNSIHLIFTKAFGALFKCGFTCKSNDWIGGETKIGLAAYYSCPFTEIKFESHAFALSLLDIP